MEKEVPSKVSSKTSPVKTPVGGEGDDYIVMDGDGYIKEWNAKSNEFVTQHHHVRKMQPLKDTKMVTKRDEKSTVR